MPEVSLVAVFVAVDVDAELLVAAAAEACAAARIAALSVVTRLTEVLSAVVTRVKPGNNPAT
ncbi:MAG: hypothetical protein WCB03_02345 [Rouxiella badensis]|uniref:hypothetical protein n=1 Tax=Rouxiella badensis TaxID=1646377 RepID=UPI003C47D73C